MELITCDLECFYGDQYTLSKMTTEEFLRDPRFEYIMWGIKINDTKPFWVLPDRAQQFFQHEVDWAQTGVVQHHAHFDTAALAWHYGVRPAFIIDTLSMARVVDGPKAGNSLAELCARHGIGTKGDFVTFAKNKHLDDFSADELRLYGEYCVNDVEKTYQLANKFLPLIPERELRLIDLTVRMFTEPVFVGDVALLQEAVATERKRKADRLRELGYICLNCNGTSTLQAVFSGVDVLQGTSIPCKFCDGTGVNKKEFTSKAKFADILRRCGVEVPMKRSNTTGEMIPAFAKTDPGMQELLEDEDEVVRFLAETRLSSTSNIIQTRAQRFLDCAKRGPMPVYLRYGGAHTWRWSGGDKMNWQNMTSRSDTRPEMTVLKRSIHAPDGHVIVSCDSAQIEARMLVWLTQQLDTLDAFTQGRDVYSEFAANTIYMRPVDRKNNPDDFIPGQLGKVSVLGLGFGMGYLKFSAELLKGMLGAPPIQFKDADLTLLKVDPTRFLNNPNRVKEVDAMVSRLDLSDRLTHCIVANEIVMRYRAKSDKVVAYWKLMDTVIDAMIQGRVVEFGGPTGKLLRTEGQSIVLPNGMRLNYRDIQRGQDKEATYWNGRERTRIYGPLLTENQVQALARIPVSDAMLTLADEGLAPRVMTHDQFAVIAREEDAQAVFDYMMAVMKQTPAWAPGLPLSAEGGIGKAYADVK